MPIAWTIFIAPFVGVVLVDDKLDRSIQHVPFAHHVLCFGATRSADDWINVQVGDLPVTQVRGPLPVSANMAVTSRFVGTQNVPRWNLDTVALTIELPHQEIENSLKIQRLLAFPSFVLCAWNSYLRGTSDGPVAA